MISEYVENSVRSIPGLQDGGLKVARAVHTAVLNGGDPVRTMADVLHGTWLGHPLHPVLTDIVIGAWSLGALFDGVASTNGSRDAERMADTLTAVGTLAAVPTAITGLTDYSTIPQHAASTGTLHGLLNSTSLVLYLLSLRDRKNGHRNRGIVFSTIGYGLAAVSAWLGGDLVYRQHVGVDHAESVSKPAEWKAVLDETELREQQPKRVEVEGHPVLLYRYGGTVYAIGAVCSHAGGPLEEGTFEELSVQCPWHDSVFDLRNGSIEHGPATYAEPNYAARIQNGRVEVRVRHSSQS
ncbi:MAG: Rieske 2Fe-2S domain-containing protein [Ardenticatenaceae bacterium]|nr:Rieske 2Fe-2S domain-containing protein [Ardenticatenaceae bacterium]